VLWGLSCQHLKATERKNESRDNCTTEFSRVPEKEKAVIIAKLLELSRD
jgi:hypothetical protein